MDEQIVIFGGSFDPVHNGHLIIAKSVANKLGAKRVVLIPTGINPLKSTSPAAGKHRLAMLELAIADDNLFEISDIELCRQPPNYTIDTVENLQRSGLYAGELNLVVGADMLSELPKWFRVEELLEKVKLVVACRPPWSRESVAQAAEKLRGRLDAKYVRKITASIIDTPLIDIASTDIREKVAAGLGIENMVPPAVAKYIKKHGLYQS